MRLVKIRDVENSSESSRHPTRLDDGPADSTNGRRWAVLLVLCLTLLVTSLDGTILNVALPTIVRRLHATSSQLQWVVDSYAIVFAGLLMIAGSLGDRLGRKWVFVAGIGAFAVGSALSAFSVTPDQLIGARAFMGVGRPDHALDTVNSHERVHESYGPGESDWFVVGNQRTRPGHRAGRGRVVALALLVGLVFLINVPIAALACIAAIFVVPDSRNRDALRPDLVGAGTSLLGVALLLWGIIEGPSRGWTSPVILGTILGSVLIVGGFIVWERHSTHPLLQMSLFSSRRFSMAMAALTLVLFSLSGGLFLLTQYLQFCLGYSALDTGLRIVPIAIVLLAVAMVSSWLVRVVGTKIVVFVGIVLIGGGFALLGMVTPHTTYAGVLPALFLLGIGSGLAFAPCTESVMGSVSLNLAGVGSATNSTALQIGSALGVAVLGSLLNTRYQFDMLQLLSHVAVPSSIKSTVLGSLGGALGVANHVGGVLGAHLASSARQSFINAMVFAVRIGALIAGAAAMVVLLFLPARPTRSVE